MDGAQGDDDDQKPGRKVGGSLHTAYELLPTIMFQ